MAAGAVDVKIEATPDAVWEKVGDFGGLGDFFPGIESFRLEGDDRIIGMFGMEIRERLLAKDDAARTITYSVIEGVPVESHTATISVRGGGRWLAGDLGLRRDPRRNGPHLRRHLQGRRWPRWRTASADTGAGAGAGPIRSGPRLP